MCASESQGLPKCTFLLLLGNISAAKARRIASKCKSSQGLERFAFFRQPGHGNGRTDLKGPFAEFAGNKPSKKTLRNHCFFSLKACQSTWLRQSPVICDHSSTGVVSRHLTPFPTSYRDAHPLLSLLMSLNTLSA